jgi:hypothetical protein
MIDVQQIIDLHRELTVLWHQQHVAESCDLGDGLLELICRQHSVNFLLSQAENFARDPHATDAVVARLKRAIIRDQDERRACIDRIDQWIADDLEQSGVQPNDDAPLNTETPGSAIDRLSTLSLQIHHLQEEARQTDVPREHSRATRKRLTICREQFNDLSETLAQLLDDLSAGRKRHKAYGPPATRGDWAPDAFVHKIPQRIAG